MCNRRGTYRTIRIMGTLFFFACSVFLVFFLSRTSRRDVFWDNKEAIAMSLEHNQCALHSHAVCPSFPTQPRKPKKVLGCPGSILLGPFTPLHQVLRYRDDAEAPKERCRAVPGSILRCKVMIKALKIFVDRVLEIPDAGVGFCHVCLGHLGKVPQEEPIKGVFIRTLISCVAKFPLEKQKNQRH
jgi:hypothetical protein